MPVMKNNILQTSSGGGGGGSITLITNTDGYLNVTGGSGPTVNIGAVLTKLQAVAFVTKAINYQLTTSDRVVKVTASGTTQTLPDATTLASGIPLTISLAYNVANCTIATLSSQTINGVLTYALGAGDSVTVVSDGTNYIVVSDYDKAASIGSIPTGTATYSTPVDSLAESPAITVTWNATFPSNVYTMTYNAYDSLLQPLSIRPVIGSQTTTTAQFIVLNMGNKPTGTITITAHASA